MKCYTISFMFSQKMCWYNGCCKRDYHGSYNNTNKLIGSPSTIATMSVLIIFLIYANVYESIGWSSL